MISQPHPHPILSTNILSSTQIAEHFVPLQIEPSRVQCLTSVTSSLFCLCSSFPPAASHLCIACCSTFIVVKMDSKSEGGIFSPIIAKLTVGNFFLLILVYITFQVIKQIVYYRFFSPIKDFPGPFWASVTRLWLAWHNLQATEVKTEQALHEKYGVCIHHCHVEMFIQRLPPKAPSSASLPRCCLSRMPPSFPRSITVRPTNPSITSQAPSAKWSPSSTCKSTMSTRVIGS